MEAPQENAQPLNYVVLLEPESLAETLRAILSSGWGLTALHRVIEGMSIMFGRRRRLSLRRGLTIEARL